MPDTFPLLLRGRYRDCPVRDVPEGDLLYRYDNGRLIAQRDAALAAAGLDPAGPGAEAQSDPAVQAVLHALLVGHASDPDGPILPELERFGRQIEPLVATQGHVVVNGNRRLAAMRTLLERDPSRFADFATVRVAMLPDDASEADIEYLEASLQMAPEVKLAYGWVNRRMKLRRQRDVLGLPADEIVDAYRLADAGRIDVELRELALAEAYADARGLDDWREVEARHELFEGLAANLAALDEEASGAPGGGGELAPADLARAWRSLGFLLIAHAGAHDPSRLYPFVPPRPPTLPRLALARLADVLGWRGDRVAGAERHARLGAGEGEGAADRAGEVVEVMAALDTEHMERMAPARALNQLRTAGAILQRLEPDRLNPAQKRQLRSDLAALSAQAAFILGEIGERPAATGVFAPPRKGLLDPPYAKVLPRIVRRLRER